MAATTWFGGGAPFGGSTLDLRRSVPVFSSLPGALWPRFLFLAGAPAPALMCLPLLFPWGLIGWRVACRSGSLVLSPGEPSELALSRGPSGGVCTGVLVPCLVPSGLALPFARVLSDLLCVGLCGTAHLEGVSL